jgi:adenylate cyclase class IV
MEFEAELPLTIDELDEKILKSDWQIEAKWQADRKIYEADGITIDIFFSPGYGYLAEFEKVVTDASDREAAHASVEDIMKKLDAKELPNDRLERMFAYYNQHWPEYYGTDKIFVIE